MNVTYLTDLFDQYTQKKALLYQTWFIHSENRLKAFNQVRKGVKQIITDIRRHQFPRDLHGSSLETVMNIIIAQQEIFKGAKHAFMWKPKLRIPDIYENRQNQLDFAEMLSQVINAKQEVKMLLAVNNLAEKKIKGLGPAVANILYFLEPTIFCPFNTSIVRGYNYLTHSKIRLGKWNDYFKLRDGMIELNEAGGLFSKDLGAVSAFLFDIGKLNYIIPETSEKYIQITERHTIKKLKSAEKETELKNLHYKVQLLLADIGNSIGYQSWIASNDHNRTVNGKRLGDYSLPSLPKTMTQLPSALQETVRLIDVIWFTKSGEPIATFEVEKSTSIMSGMNRMDDLYEINKGDMMLYIVSPDKREQEVKAQFNRPHYMHNHNLHDHIRYILFADLIKSYQSLKLFGHDYAILGPISHFPDGTIADQH
ncbi:MAG: type II restriction endonuclease [Lentilactobacillus buchneri]|nr:type II restriction endonuclease [Lentilactobacillus buchneri]MCI2019879.1 type II restriction endonuclease [Lentilactobacillus buchneri]MCI2028277.1 type II restriction endonuclease [Lentilactobacillus buchneri]